MQVDQGRFCSLSSNRDWQNWLRNTDQALYGDLMATRAAGRGCNANKEKMKQIYSALYARGKGEALEELIKERFAYLIIGSVATSEPPKAQPKPKPLTPSVKVFAPTNASNLNKHGVFESYRPNILTFPKKMIFQNTNRAQLEAIVKHFLKDKVSFDYLIIDDRAYVEYFDAQHQAEAERIPKDSRDIHKYRIAHGGP
jgi:hypothetical protein